jgi:hypothetical protein
MPTPGTSAVARVRTTTELGQVVTGEPARGGQDLAAHVTDWEFSAG